MMAMDMRWGIAVKDDHASKNSCNNADTPTTTVMKTKTATPKPNFDNADPDIDSDDACDDDRDDDDEDDDGDDDGDGDDMTTGIVR